MYIWDWVSIAFGWLVILFLTLCVIAFVKKNTALVKRDDMLN